MEGLVLVGLAVLAIPVAVIYLLVSVSSLKTRVAFLEAALRDAAVEKTAPPATTKAPSPKAEPARAAPWAAATSNAPPKDQKSETPKRQSTDTPKPDPAPAAPPRAVVFRRDRAQALFAWLAANWFYAVSAVSLALAGVFLVQYGMENGLLPPRARVAAALGFGAALIAAGEWIRRRWGDGEDSSTAYLPSVFSGAGIVTLFGGILSARILYDLIGPETALIGLVATALVALVLGWFHGPLLAAVGIVGAFGAPFVVGGSSDDPSWFYGYFALIALLGLGIDTIRRWAWVSVLTLVLAYGAGYVLAAGSQTVFGAFMAYAGLVIVLAVLIPVRRLMPDHAGSTTLQSLRRGQHPRPPWPEFPTRIAGGAVLTSTVLIALGSQIGAAEFWLAIALFAALTAALIIWSRNAPALQDLAALPALGLGFAIFAQGEDRGPVYTEFVRTYYAEVEADFPWTVTALVTLAAFLALLALWRSFQSGSFARIWGAAAALFAPAIALLLEIAWRPSETLGAYPWALHAAALAALATLMAERFARADGPADRLRTGIAMLSALASIVFALVLIFSQGALTLALAATVLAAVVLDRRFDLPALTVFISAGVIAAGYRLVVDPGIDRAMVGPSWEFVLTYGAVLVLFVASLGLLRPAGRDVARVMLDSACWSVGGIFVSLLLGRWIETLGSDGGHWAFGMLAAIWLTLALAQVQRWDISGWMRRVRIGLAALFGVIGLGCIALGATVFNPLIEDFLAGRVVGAPVINSLLLAYLAPALVLGLGAWRIASMPLLMRRGCYGLAGALGALWLFAVIRHFWQGPDALELSFGMGQPELYTYTVVLLLAGAGLFYQSLAGGREALRKAGLAVIGLAVAKVFLIDISGLQGLTRVFSLLALGVSLAGLAWLNRWAQGKGDQR